MTPDEARALLGQSISEAVAALIAEDREREVEQDRGEDRWPEFMRVPTAAAYCDVSEERIRTLIERRTIAVVQEAPGHRILIERTELDRVLRGWRQR